MPKIIAVHGISNQFEVAESLKAAWLPHLRGGLVSAGHDPDLLQADDLAVAFYGHIFRADVIKKGPAMPLAKEQRHPDVIELLTAWCEAAADLDPSIARPSADGPTKGLPPAPRSFQWLLEQLSKSKVFSAIGGPDFIAMWIHQVWSYFNNLAVREIAVYELTRLVDGETKVIIGHSLGSVVAYEALCANPQWKIDSFVSFGSPLGIPNMVFERLKPAPVARVGVWPNVANWTNIADSGDIVALRKDLGKLFGERVRDVRVNNGWDPHSIVRFMNTREMGAAIANGLRH